MGQAWARDWSVAAHLWLWGAGLCGGIRWWDYNTEIWNWGNIGGYVCLRSVAVFALAGYALMQIVVPLTAVLILYVGEGLAFPPTALLGAVYLADYIWGYFVKGF